MEKAATNMNELKYDFISVLVLLILREVYRLPNDGMTQDKVYINLRNVLQQYILNPKVFGLG